MKKLIATGIIAVAMTSGSLFAGAPAEFAACSACHNPTAEMTGPALKRIAAAYGGNQGKLLSFLKGNAKPIVEPTKFAIMQGNLAITKSWTTAQQKKVADYILSQK